jgi:hypothetical protein
VDLIHHLGTEPIGEELTTRSSELEVLSVVMPVLEATALLESKMRVLQEHECDFTSLLQVARALREQVDWQDVQDFAEGNDYAAAFLFLLRRLEVAPSA